LSEGIDRKKVDKLHRRLKGDGRRVRRYVITAAQNATPINKPFFTSLLSYCRHQRAQLIVIPYRYKNPTSMWSAKAESDDWWATELTPYLLDRRWEICDNLIILGDIKTQPTANSPLQGFETITAGDSAVVGHPKLELTTIATPHKKLPKILTTTGAVTERNYLASKAGKKGEHHHTFGACVVEIKDDLFHLRQLNAVKDGSFMDLEWEYAGAERKISDRAAALVMGDSHVEFIDPGVVKATFGKEGMIDALEPQHVVWHDVHDFYSRNHHDKDKVFVNYVKHHTGHGNVEKWLDNTFKFIDDNTRTDVINVFVPSNHSHEHLERWVNDTDPRTDPENCVFWARTFEAMCLGARMTESGAKTIDPFTYWGKKKLKTVKQARFLSHDESMQIQGIEVGYHGHQGINGARGTRAAYGKIGVKTVIGHAHSPGIKDGVYQTGTSSRLRLAYNHGPSSWLHTHCLIYPNGKRTLINIINGEWRA
jgi:hypothetical protein